MDRRNEVAGMSLGNTLASYGAVARTLHWLTAFLVLTAIPLGLIANRMTFASDAEIGRVLLIFSLHKTVGLMAFGIGIVRIAWAVTQPRPVPLRPERRVETGLAATVHAVIYISLVLVPLSGWLSHAATTGYAPVLLPFGDTLPFVPKSAAVADFFGGCHRVFTKVLTAAVLLHLLGAAKHALVDRDATLARMVSGAAPEAPAAVSVGRGPATAAVTICALALGLGAWVGSRPPQPAPEADAPAAGWTVLAIAATIDGAAAEAGPADFVFDPGAGLSAGTLALTVAGRALDVDIIDAPEGYLGLGDFGGELVELRITITEADGRVRLSGTAETGSGRLAIDLTARAP